MSPTGRIVVLVDMDCFYCQVEEKFNPNLVGKPVAVVQYNAWKGGGIIAVNYRARERGVTRHMRGDEAKQKCPEIELARVPTIRGKADLTKYRDAGKSVAKVLQTFTPLIERASVDEAYLDITEAVEERLKQTSSSEITLNQIKNTYVVGFETIDFLYNLYNSGLYMESDLKLAVGGVIAEEIRAAVHAQTGYTCSAGIAHNKILAKLACGLHKPNRQTILPQGSVEELYKNLPVRKIRNLGGKFGNTLSEDLGIVNMAELVKFSEKELRKRYDDKTATWLFNIARGIDLDPVTTRLVPKSIGCCKKFSGKSALIDAVSVKHWLNELAREISERLEKDLEENNRKAKQIVVSFSQDISGKEVTNSRTHNLNSYDPTKIASDAFEIIRKNCMKASGTFCVKFLGYNVGKFEDCRNVNEITAFFKIGSDSNKNITKQNNEDPEAKTKKNSEYKTGVKSNSISSFFVKNYKTTSAANLQQGNFDERQSKEDSCTIFSDSTVDLDENSSDFVFYNEDRGQTETISDGDSISDELSSKHSNDSNEIQPEKESFFLRYFKSLKRDQKSPVPRDFNTSRIFEEPEDYKTSFNNVETILENPAALDDKNSTSLVDTAICSTNVTYKIPDMTQEIFTSEETVEVCNICSIKIYKSEMISHMDYHFALKIVREESEFHKNDPQSLTTPKQIKKEFKKKLKRKSVEVAKKTTLESFFNMQMKPSENFDKAELCPHCNRKIDAENFVSHLDYHVAKKLHLEINPIKSCVTENSKSQKNEDTGILKRNKQSTTSVMAFFKPVN